MRTHPTRRLTTAVAALTLGAALSLGGAPSASAQIAKAPATLGLTGDSGMTATQVQYRRGGRYYGRPRAFGFRPYRPRGYYYGPHPGVALGLGLATGAVIGGAIAAQSGAAAAAEADALAYCEQRFRSWDPETRTYLGYDGERHPCP